MKKFDVEIKGQRMQGAVAQTGQTIWYSLNGEVWTVDTAARTGRGAPRGGLADANIIVAPMPGKIIKVLVEGKARVTAGQTLVVMEAMKMEYTLKASAEGVVEEVNCSAGEQVALGTTLVKLKSDAGAKP